MPTSTAATCQHTGVLQPPRRGCAVFPCVDAHVPDACLWLRALWFGDAPLRRTTRLRASARVLHVASMQLCYMHGPAHEHALLSAPASQRTKLGECREEDLTALVNKLPKTWAASCGYAVSPKVLSSHENTYVCDDA